jgi:hypothetical protein
MLNTSFSNKTQLKIKIKIEFFLLDRTRSNTFIFRPDLVRPWTVENETLHCQDRRRRGEAAWNCFRQTCVFNVNCTGFHKQEIKFQHWPNTLFVLFILKTKGAAYTNTLLANREIHTNSNSNLKGNTLITLNLNKTISCWGVHCKCFDETQPSIRIHLPKYIS